MNFNIIGKFIWRKEKCPVVLLVISLTSKILFQKNVFPFNLFVTLRMKYCTQLLLNAKRVHQIFSKQKCEKLSIIRYNYWRYFMQLNNFLCDHFYRFSFNHVWTARYLITYFWEFIYIHKGFVVFVFIFNTIREINNEIYGENIQCFCFCRD